MRELSLKVSRQEQLSSIWVGRSLIGSITSLIDLNQYSKIIIVGDSGAGASVSSAIKSFQEKGLSVGLESCLMLSGGEACKSLEHLAQVWEFFVRQRLDRKAAVLAVGGGAITDLVGFAAATYMRGIDFYAVPTTLLSQVDASIGGKSGINFAGTKNILGSISQPRAVIIDVDTLGTLSERERRSGFAEIVKHGLIADRSYYEYVTSRHHLEWSLDELVEIIYRSCQIKAQVVAADETEQGPRKNLNFGHTLGHAIEAWSLGGGVTSGEVLTHGEAIAIGMHAAAMISFEQGLISKDEVENIREALKRVGLPIYLPEPVAFETLKSHLSRDKKNLNGQARWTLLGEVGHAIFNQQVDEEVVLRVFKGLS